MKYRNVYIVGIDLLFSEGTTYFYVSANSKKDAMKKCPYILGELHSLVSIVKVNMRVKKFHLINK